MSQAGSATPVKALSRAAEADLGGVAAPSRSRWRDCRQLRPAGTVS
jgi:hypothetical protein